MMRKNIRAFFTLVRTPGGVPLKKALTFSALPLVLLFAAAFQSPNSVPGQLAAIQAKLDSLETQLAALATKGQRQFYLTKTVHDGAHALTACAMGYHMASLWEIHEPSNLRYNTQLGQLAFDSGSGPPAFLFGWIRTGFNAVGGGPGFDYCSGWTSSDPSDHGSTAALDAVWDHSGYSVSPWRAQAQNCNFDSPVWCVED